MNCLGHKLANHLLYLVGDDSRPAEVCGGDAIARVVIVQSGPGMRAELTYSLCRRCVVEAELLSGHERTYPIRQAVKT